MNGRRVSLAALLGPFVALPEGVDRPITGVSLDSRRVRPGDLFLACAGTRVSGALFIEAAVAAGAAAVAVDLPAPELPAIGDVPLVAIPGLAHRAGEIAARFHGDPSRQMTVIGVTGTNGKTSVSHFIAQLLQPDGGCGLIGTLGAGLPGELRDLGHTTPDPVTLQGELARLHQRGVQRVAMEVSSHALDQHRVAGVAFDIAVFTNLSRDHLDYHGDMERYGAAKRRLLELSGVRHAVVNLDDPMGRRWWADLPAAVEGSGYSLAAPEHEEGRRLFYAEGLRLDREGLHLRLQTPWGGADLEAGLMGRFNAANLIAACAAALLAGLPFPALAERVGALRTVPGRMEPFGGPGKPLVVVDYAHTPDALEQALRALREHTAARVWCVFGCGGERDRGKRPLMGGIAERFADAVILTDDNPRGEDSRKIIEEIMGGIDRREAIRIQPDRAAAIGEAVAAAGPGDVVLIAGKGHEQYQQVGVHCRPFSDRAEVARLVGGRHG